jgi:hypothetical protein
MWTVQQQTRLSLTCYIEDFQYIIRPNMPPAQDNQTSGQSVSSSNGATASSPSTSQPLTQSLGTVPDTVASLKASAAAGKAGDEALLRQTIAQAQQVVLKTKDDPFMQVQELEKLKASYMQTRYGQTIKAADN